MNPAKKTRPKSRPPRKARLRRSEGSISGVPRPLRSTSAKRPRSRTPSASRPKIQPGQPSSRPWTSVDQRERRGADQQHAEPVELDGVRRLGLRHEPQRQQQPGDPDRQVDEEDHPPARAEQVGAREPAAEDRPGDRRDPHHRAERGERGAELAGREDLLDDPQPLRDEERPERALHGAGRDQRAGARGQRARGGGEREAGHADEEHAAPPEDVAEPAADDEQDAERERVAGRPPLHRGRAGAEVAADHGRRDGDDRAVEQVHDLRGQDDPEDEPAPGVAGRLRGGRGGGRVGGVARIGWVGKG